MAIQTDFYDRVRYELRHSSGAQIITEPIGWDSSEKEFSRHETYHGMVANFSNSIKFVESAKDFIETVFKDYGVNAKIEIIRSEKHPKTDKWTVIYRGFLDLTTFKKENNQVAVKINNGGLLSLLKSRVNEKLELDRTTSLDGNDISGLDTVSVSFTTRQIPLESRLEATPGGNIRIKIRSNSRNLREGNDCFPLTPVEGINSHGEHLSSTNPVNEDQSPENTPKPNGFFFVNSPRQTKLSVAYKLSHFVRRVDNENVDGETIKIRLVKYDDSANNHRLLEEKVLIEHTPPYYSYGLAHNLEGVWDVDVDVGDNLALEFYLSGTEWKDGWFDKGSDLIVEILDISISNITIREDSWVEASTGKGIRMGVVGKKLMEIISGQPRFKSNYLDANDFAITHGFWVRGFSKDTENFKPITTSFKDYFSGLHAVLNVGMGVERDGFDEVVRLEPISYFFPRQTTIKISNKVSNIQRSFATEYAPSSIEVGYEKGGEYEEAYGLYEYNTKTNYTTSIVAHDKKLSLVSPYRADSYGMEFARRKREDLKEDTPYDDEIFWLDLKRSFNAFLQREWRDDLEESPVNVYDPDSATNLRLTPLTNLLRHGNIIQSGVLPYLDDYLRYISSVGKSDITTHQKGRKKYSENQNIPNADLDRARFIPEWIEFNSVVDFDIWEQLNGTSLIDGEDVPNFYGLVEFINEDNKKEHGFLFTLNPEGEGKWKLLKVNL